MDRVQHPHPNDPIYRRLDELELQAWEAASARASMEHADMIVDGVCRAVAAIRSTAVSVARHFKSAFVSSPQH
jgi:hypothetical protein